MATLNYVQRLANLQNRRYDQELKESVLTKSFSATDLPENVKYLFESMKSIDQKYNDRTFVAAGNVQKHLQDGYNLHFNRAYKTQGSVITGTNIKVHSDFDLLAIIDRYFYPELTGGTPYTASDPDADIKELRTQSVKILKGIYDEVDDSGEKSISIFNKSLNRKVDVVFCFWYHSAKYVETNNEYYRGIKFANRDIDYPFAHLQQVNTKGDNTSDGSRKGIRLLKTLKADCETELQSLKSFHLTTIVHSIPNLNLLYAAANELNIAKAISSEMGVLLENSTYRKEVKSPNGIEKPLAKDEVVSEIKRLKEDLDILIEDSSKELNSTSLKKAILTY